MAAGGTFIERLRRDWENTFGYDNFPFHFRCIAGDADEFVPKNSAYANFPIAYRESIPGGHLDIVKPDSPDHLAVRIVVKGLREHRPRPKKQKPSAKDIDPSGQLPPEIFQYFLDYYYYNPPDKDDLLSGAYQKAVPGEYRREYGLPEPENIKWPDFMRQWLDCPPSPKRSRCLLKFFRLLKEPVNQNDKKFFDEKIKALEQYLKDDEQPDENEIDNEKLPLYLMIDLEAHSHGKIPVFTARVYEWRAKDKISAQEEFFKMEEGKISSHIDSLLCTLGPDERPYGIDVFLNREWLTVVRPEGWELKQKRTFKTTLGKAYPVVVRLKRSGEQIHPEFLSSWKKRWDYLREQKTLKKDICYSCTLSDLENPGALYDKLIGDDGKCFLSLACNPPKPSFDKAGLSDVILETGIPAAMWGDVDEQEIKKLSDNCEIDNLPEQHHNFRKKENSPANKITLMWDNPDRFNDKIVHRALPETGSLTDNLLKGPMETV